MKPIHPELLAELNRMQKGMKLSPLVVDEGNPLGLKSTRPWGWCLRNKCQGRVDAKTWRVSPFCSAKCEELVVGRLIKAYNTLTRKQKRSEGLLWDYVKSQIRIKAILMAHFQPPCPQNKGEKSS